MLAIENKTVEVNEPVKERNLRKTILESITTIQGINEIIQHFNKINQIDNLRGSLFEFLCKQETIESRFETAEQKQYKKIIFNIVTLYQQLLGKEKMTSNPDDIDIVFNKNGEIEIIEIHEDKLSSELATHKQAQNSITLIEDVASIFNELSINGFKLDGFYDKYQVPTDKRQKSEIAIKKIRGQILEIEKIKQITVSQELIYIIKIPGKSVKSASQKIVNNIGELSLKNGNSVKHKIERSTINEDILLWLIDHYREQI